MYNHNNPGTPGSLTAALMADVNDTILLYKLDYWPILFIIVIDDN